MTAGLAASALAQVRVPDGPPVDLDALPAVSASAPALPGEPPAPYAGGQIARDARLGILGSQRLVDVPFSVTSYTARAIENQQARTLADVLDNDPAVRSTIGFGDFSQVFNIRGFRLKGDDVGLNGLFGLAPQQLVNVDAVERVQVFKGTSAFLNGVTPTGSGIGGTVDLQMKRAAERPVARLTVNGTASGEVGAHVDLGQRFGAAGQFGIRVNTSAMGGETAIRGEHRRSRDASVSLDYRGDSVRLYADFLYQRQRITGGRPGVFVTGAALPPLPAATYNYSQTWVFSEFENSVAMLRGEYDVAPDWTVYAAGGIHHGNEHGYHSTPNYDGSTGQTTANRLGLRYKSDAAAGEIGMRGRFATGAITHSVNAAASITHVETLGAFNRSRYPTRLYDPPQIAPPAAAAAPRTTGRTLLRSVAMSDTFGFLNDRILLTVGLRRQQINVNGYAYDGGQTAAYDDGVTTPLLGVVFKPLDRLAVYANRSEGLTQGGTAPVDAINAGQVMPPYRAKQIEAGVKYDAKTYGATLALFQITQPSAYTDPVSLIYGSHGTERHRGVEIALFGEPLRDLRLLGGASYLAARQLDTGNPATDGKRPIGVPDWLFNLGAEWDVPRSGGLTLTVRTIYTGRQYVDPANALSLSPWQRLDLGARYRTRIANRATTLRATLFNATNRPYWASSLGGILSLGAPRTLMLSLTTDF